MRLRHWLPNGYLRQEKKMDIILYKDSDYP